MPRQADLTTGAARLQVVAGILQDTRGRVLIADRRRSRSLRDHWEFPGGKVAPGESAREALKRELDEELGIEIGRCTHFQALQHDYDDVAVAIDFFLVEDWSGQPEGREGQKLRWVCRDLLDPAELLPADAPVIAALRDR